MEYSKRGLSHKSLFQTRKDVMSYWVFMFFSDISEMIMHATRVHPKTYMPTKAQSMQYSTGIHYLKPRKKNSRFESTPNRPQQIA
ncbi:hypothetical protein BDV40DRAFT_257643 [Aspergillus tamarii]|uniref:Uncharacterized protein n=1 Tax=Aspergillus tamarii TaxID=41984 RepID=A0A5N6V4A3_ASPTM|nr:hypothetical protein BDV40DRAFT_257643 [Aspergillus tamarii]